MKRVWMAVWGGIFLFGATILAEEEPVTPIFRATSSQVVFEFIAVDKDGRLVPDLKTDELEVTVDGKKQKLDFLVSPDRKTGVGYVSAPQVAREAGEAAAPGGGSGDGAAPSAATPLSTVILLDTRVLDASNFSHSVDAIRRFINRSLYADSLVMLAEIDRGLKIVTPFTHDRETLLKGVESLRPATVYNPLDRSQLSANLGAAYFDDLLKQVSYLREGLTLLCRALSGSAGNKHIVFFSEGYPLNPIKELEVESRQQAGLAGADARQAVSRTVASRKDPGVLPMVQDVVSLANTYGVKFYTVDARGLVAVSGVGPANVTGDFAAGPGDAKPGDGPRGEQSETGLTEVQVSNLQLTQLGSLDDAQNMLLALAGGTNGSAFFNSNDLGIVLRASTSEDRLTYLGSFKPGLKGKPKFRELRVKCKRKGVIVRSQAGFTDFSPQQVLGLQLTAAFEHPEFFQALHPFVELQTGQAPIEVVMGLPGSEATARPTADKFHLSLGFVGRVFDEDGKPVSKGFDIQRSFAGDLSREQFGGLAVQPLKAKGSLSLSHGKHRLVLAAVDQVSGAVGTVVKEFSVP